MRQIEFVISSFIILSSILSCKEPTFTNKQDNGQQVDMSGQSAFDNLNADLSSLNIKFGTVETRSVSWQKISTIAGSDAVGAVLFGLITSSWWGALGGAVASSFSSAASGNQLDSLLGVTSSTPPSHGGNNNVNVQIGISDFVGYDDNGNVLYYDHEDLEEDLPEVLDMEEEIQANLGMLHNEVLIYLIHEYKDSLLTFSNSEIMNKATECIGSWYNLDSSEIPFFAFSDESLLDTMVNDCVIDGADEYYFDLLSEKYSAHTGVLSVIETILTSGLEVAICSNGLWIEINPEEIEEDDEDGNED